MSDLVHIKSGSIMYPKGAEREIALLEQEHESAIQRLKDFIADPSISPKFKEQAESLQSWLFPDDGGFENITTRSQFVRVQIAQPTTSSSAKPDNAKAGDLFTTGGDLIPRPMKIRIIRGFQSHIYFEQGERAPQCVSPDGILGSPKGLCVNCEYMPMGKQVIPGTNPPKVKPWKEQQPSKCSAQIVLIAVDDTYKRIYEIAFAKTSYGIGSAIVSLAKGFDKYWSKEIALDTEKKSNNQGVFWVYRGTPAGNPIDKEADKLCQLIGSFYSSGRLKMLREYYDSFKNSDASAAKAESSFDLGAAMSGLSGDAGIEVNLNESPTASSSKAATSNKPM